MCQSTGIIEEEDDQDVVQATFRQAYKNSQHQTVCVPGLQDFAGAVSFLCCPEACRDMYLCKDPIWPLQ